MNCALQCMQAHRGDEGDIYTLNLRNEYNEPRNYILLDANGKNTPLFCRHCDTPECLMSCVSGALSKDEKTGHIEYDEKKCAACFMCVMGCPYGLPKPDSATGEKIIRCDFCSHDELGPNCVRGCSKEAIYLGEVPAI